MSKVTITMNGRAFTIGCEEGQQAYLRSLASHLDGHVQELAEKVGQIGELRLLLMAALIVADEYKEATGRVETLEDELSRLGSQSANIGTERRADRAQAAEAINSLADKLEALSEPS